MATPSELAIGIDLGTTYSCVGVFRNGQVEIIANDQGNRTMPSVVSFTSNDRLVGESAVNAAVNNPKNTIFGVKRLIGRKCVWISSESLCLGLHACCCHS